MRDADQGSENNALTLILSQIDTLMSHSRILSTFSAEDWTESKGHFASYCLTAVTYCKVSVLLFLFVCFVFVGLVWFGLLVFVVVFVCSFPF